LGNRDASEFEFLKSGVRHPESERSYLIEINSFIDNGELQLYWSYSREHYLKETMEVLLKKFDTTLKETIIHCTEIGQGKFTPSDFPELGLDQDDLDGLLDSLDL
jgi:non-ribosomal peptide synthase protein (TIGR01720 family)